MKYEKETKLSPDCFENEKTSKAISILLSAFVADPVIRWMYPKAEDYLRHFPTFLKAFSGPALYKETVFIDETEKTCAIWLSPTSEVYEGFLEKVLLETVAVCKQKDLFETLSSQSEAHPTYPHWYLPWFGTDTWYQSHGFGSKLLSKNLKMIDADNLPAYLETPNPRNIEMYRRHGFKVTGQTQNGDCPVITFMTRPPKRP